MNREETMTKEQAIDILQNGAKYENDEDFDEKLYEARQVAVEALKATPCEDAVDRGTIIREMEKRHKDGDAITLGYIKNLPPVTPKQRIGKWIEGYNETLNERVLYCDKCHDYVLRGTNYDYCPNCGARMEGGSE